MGGLQRKRLVFWLVAISVLGVIPEAIRASSDKSVVALIVPEHKLYQAAAEQCATALRNKGIKPVAFTFQKEPAVLATAPADSGTPATSSNSVDPQFWSKVEAVQPVVIIAFGEQAALACLKSTRNVPVVHSMILNLLDSPVTTDAEYRKRTAGVTPDLRPADQLNWIHEVQRNMGRVVVLHSSQTGQTAAAIREAGKQTGVEVGLLETSTDQFAQAIDAITAEKYDAALMLPDAQVYNTASVKRLLLWGIRQKKGVWSFSENFVRAGALGCLYTTPESIGNQTAALVVDVLAGKDPSSIGVVYPQSVERALNRRTAKLIGLSLPNSLLNGVTLLGDE